MHLLSSCAKVTIFTDEGESGSIGFKVSVVFPCPGLSRDESYLAPVLSFFPLMTSTSWSVILFAYVHLLKISVILNAKYTLRIDVIFHTQLPNAILRHLGEADPFWQSGNFPTSGTHADTESPEWGGSLEACKAGISCLRCQRWR